jgi:hypothetical protein
MVSAKKDGHDYIKSMASECRQMLDPGPIEPCCQPRFYDKREGAEVIVIPPKNRLIRFFSISLDAASMSLDAAHPVVHPPSTRSVVPVVNLAASEAR